MVPWAGHIDKHKDYPSSALLEFANILKVKVSTGKRLFEINEEAAEDADDNANDLTSYSKKKAKNTNGKKKGSFTLSEGKP